MSDNKRHKADAYDWVASLIESNLLSEGASHHEVMEKEMLAIIERMRNKADKLYIKSLTDNPATDNESEGGLV